MKPTLLWWHHHPEPNVWDVIGDPYCCTKREYEDVWTWDRPWKILSRYNPRLNDWEYQKDRPDVNFGKRFGTIVFSIPVMPMAAQSYRDGFGMRNIVEIPPLGSKPTRRW